MNRSKYISLLLAVLLSFTALAFPMTAEAEVNYSGLNQSQQYYIRLLGSLARADYYETDVLASVTVAQAIYEGGWGSYSLPIGGNNLFGIKAYSSWDGKVYDQTSSTLYNSYADFLLSLGSIRSGEVSAWRAHDSWAESVRVHSNLFLENESYAPVVGEENYYAALQAIVDGGYCNDDGYVQEAADILERYGLDFYDDLTPDSDGIVALTASSERVYLDVGESHALTVTYYPSDKKPSKVTWASDDPSVAKVDKNGKITAVAHGTALITATLANGREACCIVYVDCNATIIDQNVFVRTEPSADADNNGKIYRGNGVKITSDAVYTDGEGNEYIAVQGYNSEGELVKGFVLAKYVYKKNRKVSSIAVVKDDITLVPSQKYTVVAAVSPADATDAVLGWTSSDASVVSVDKNGVITAKKAGNAVVTAVAAGGLSKSIGVTVADSAKEYKGIVTVADTLTVRSAAAWGSGSLGSLAFLSEVTVHGEPNGYWYNVTGTTTRGKTVNGYVYAAYTMLVPESDTVSYGTADSSVSVFEGANTSSKKLGALAAGSEIAVIGAEKDGWSYLIGKSSDGDGIYGYAKLDGSADISHTVAGGSVSAESWYGIVTSDTVLNVRDIASAGGSIVGKFESGEKITVSGEEDGWYKVSGTGADGADVSGYASADYIAILYTATVINIDDNLNVRSEPSTSGEIVGKLQNNDELTVIGEAENGWYHIETDDMTGYCSADYIKINGKIFAETPNVTPPEESDPSEDPPADEDFSITNANLSITDGILYGVSENTTVSDLIACFTGSVAVLDKNGAKLEDTDLVGTGSKISVTENGTASTVATVVVRGDADGSGNITSTDYILVKRSFFGTYKLENFYLRASKVSGEETLNVMDYIMIKRAYFGTYKL